MRYVYTGSKTAEKLAEAGFDVTLRKGQQCDPVRRPDGRVIRSTAAGTANALVRFADGTVTTVSPRRLRLTAKLPRVYLVGCSRSKRDGPARADQLYTGDLFQKSRAYVYQQSILDDHWYILSALHRVLHPSMIVFPYDLGLRDLRASERRAWAQGTAEELLARFGQRTHVIVLAGCMYREHLLPKLRAEGHPCSVPMAGLGIGEQKRWLMERVGTY